MLPCVNCKREIPEDQARVIFEVLVCPDCYKVADLLYSRGKTELHNYLVLLKDMIRTSLIAGALQLKRKDESDPDVIQRLVQMREFMAGAHLLEEPGGRLNTDATDPPAHVRTLSTLGQEHTK